MSGPRHSPTSRARMARRQQSSEATVPPLFASDPDLFHNAHLDRGFISWGLYADGYRRAAELLVKQAKTYRDRNTLIYPIVFLYRQYLELSLKDFITQGNRVEVRNPRPMHHRLNALWDICCRIARERGLPISKGRLRIIKQHVDEFERFDPTSEAFRYPVTTKNTPSIPDHGRRLSLRGLAAAMRGFSKAFRELSSLLDADVDIYEEFAYDE